MSRLVIEGGKTLSGTLAVHGAKNAVLPILAASILCDDGVTVIHNCPDLEDVKITIKILRCLGAKVKKQGDTITVDARGRLKSRIPRRLMRKLRSSIIFMGAIAARNHKAQISTPGGCELGARPIDLHIKALEELGFSITEKRNYLHVKKESTGSETLCLSFPSVGATENVLLATCLLPGTTTIVGAAKEPEIVDLANFLVSMGAEIKGAGTPIIEITGVFHLHASEYTIMPDRIAAITYLCCAAATGGSICLTNTVPEHLEIALSDLAKCGCHVEAEGDKIFLRAPQKLTALPQIVTAPYPGFPTDAQSLFLALLAKAEGTSIIREQIFENRFRTARPLQKMGANITVQGNCATIKGVSKLEGQKVAACDLRSGAALVIAGLSAEGVTEIDKVCYIDRGYEFIEKNLRHLGASIKRR